MFSITIETVGNPDFGQYAPITDPQRLNADTFQELKASIRQYQYDNMIGGGNWANPTLYQDENPIGSVSYNGRVWELGKNYPDAKEVNVC
jgi:hypothetical protein